MHTRTIIRSSQSLKSAQACVLCAGPRPPSSEEYSAPPVKLPCELELVDSSGHREDKTERPTEYTTWRYEVFINQDFPENQYSCGSPPTDRWRCQSCYAMRHETFCFGMNDPGTTACENCGKTQVDAGWSLWLQYHELPAQLQQVICDRQQTILEKVIRTKWPNAQISYL